MPGRDGASQSYHDVRQSKERLPSFVPDANVGYAEAKLEEQEQDDKKS